MPQHPQWVKFTARTLWCFVYVKDSKKTKFINKMPHEERKSDYLRKDYGGKGGIASIWAISVRYWTDIHRIKHNNIEMNTLANCQFLC